jgi:hypothetical protein
MNISNILHPELVYDTRGSEFLRKCYKWAFEATTLLGGSRCSFDLNKLSGRAQSFLLPYLTSDFADEYVRNFRALKKFRVNHGKIYYIPRDFFKALSLIDKEVRLEYYPTNFFCYFAFPKNFIKDPDGEFFNGVYVSCETPIRGTLGERTKNLELWFVTMREGDVPEKFMKFTVKLKDNLNLSEIIVPKTRVGLRVAGGSSGVADFGSQANLFIAIANAILFVQNESDEIVHLREASNPARRNGKPIQTTMGPAINNCSLPVELLSFNFHKRSNFNIDSTEVRGHFRWQPHGPGLSKVKLIWIDPHTRHFNVDDAIRSSRLESSPNLI